MPGKLHLQLHYSHICSMLLPRKAQGDGELSMAHDHLRNNEPLCVLIGGKLHVVQHTVLTHVMKCVRLITSGKLDTFNVACSQAAWSQFVCHKAVSLQEDGLK